MVTKAALSRLSEDVYLLDALTGDARRKATADEIKVAKASPYLVRVDGRDHELARLYSDDGSVWGTIFAVCLTDDEIAALEVRS